MREVRSFPAQLIERFTAAAPDGSVSGDVDWSDWPDRFDRGRLLFHGDRPSQPGFNVHRVNDYDLQIQHNEAVNLAVEHLGADRTKTDSFFHWSTRPVALRITDMLGEEVLVVEPQ